MNVPKKNKNKKNYIFVIFFWKEILKVNFELWHFNLLFFPIFYDGDIGHPISHKVPRYLVLNYLILIEVPRYPKIGRPLWMFPYLAFLICLQLHLFFSKLTNQTPVSQNITLENRKDNKSSLSGNYIQALLHWSSIPCRQYLTHLQYYKNLLLIKYFLNWA